MQCDNLNTHHPLWDGAKHTGERCTVGGWRIVDWCLKKEKWKRNHRRNKHEHYQKNKGACSGVGGFSAFMICEEDVERGSFPRWEETMTEGGNASPPPNPLFLRCRHVRLCKAGIPREGVHTYHSVAERRLWRYSKARAEDMKLMTEYITRLLFLPENKIK